MIKKHNPCTDFEEEVLSLIQEECAEVIQAISKTRRFGWDSYHPTDSEKIDNRTHLEIELGDLLCLVEILVENGVISSACVHKAIVDKRERLKQFSNLFQ